MCSRLSPKHYAYGATSECATTAPDDDGKFDEDEKKKNNYVCASNYLLDLVSQKRRCVTELQCIYTVAGIVTSTRTCIGRDEWLWGNSKNVANVFSAETVPGDESLSADPAQICVNRLQNGPSSIKNAVLLDEKICVCQDTFLDVRESELACLPSPITFDENALEFSLSFRHSKETVEMSVLMNTRICRDIGGYVTSDVKRCVLSCPKDEFVLSVGVCTK